MSAEQLLADLERRGVILTAEGDLLRFRAPAGAITAELRARLAAHKPELLALLRGRAGRATGGIPLVAREGDLPLSFAQEGLWFLNTYDPHDTSYNESIALQLTGAIDLPVLQRALDEIYARHEVLRCTFASVDGRPVQRVAPPTPLPLPVIDLSTEPEPTRAAAAREAAVALVVRPYDLASGPLARFALLRLAPQVHVLVACGHHVILDHWSLGLFARELAVLYRAFRRGEPSPLPPLPCQYADFAAWQRRNYDSPAIQAQLAYWLERLHGVEPLRLPADRAHSRELSAHGGFVDATVPPALARELKALAARHRATLFMLLVAAFQVLLHRCSGQRDVVIGTPFTRRSRAELEGLIGYFLDNMVLRGDLRGDPTFAAYLGTARERVLEGFANQDVPFEKLVEALQPARAPGRHPIFQVMFIMENSPRADFELEGLSVAPVPFEAAAVKFDLRLMMEDRADGLHANWAYRSDLFDRATVERLARNFNTLLAGIAANAERRVSVLPLLADDERQRVVVDWNATAAPHPEARRVHAEVFAQAARTPDAAAVEFEGRTLSYRELASRVAALGHALRAAGVRPETRVAVCLERSAALVVALLGVHVAGGAYVPLDPAYPRDRLEYVLRDAGADVLLTQAALRATLPPGGTRVLCLDDDGRLEAAADAAADEDGADASDIVDATVDESLAYVIYTSGSSGWPKGVGISHRALSNFVESMRRRPGLGPRDVLLAVTTVSFDIAALELLVPLTAGARVVVAPGATLADGVALAALLARCGASVMQATPATWRLLRAAGWEGASGLKVLCGGEALPADLAADLLPRCAALWNMYGPTETTVWSSVHHVERVEQPVPVGRPIDNTTLYVLSDALEPLPIGTTGDLYIGGDGVARGYHGRPGMTADRFVPDPFARDATRGARMYRTGDLARWRPDGTLEVLGRSDTQVKVRGFRIELGEIEETLRRHAGVRDAVVMAPLSAQGDRHLVAYVVPVAPPVDTDALRSHLRGSLPEYMVPGIFVELEALPRTPNGKIDRRALPAADAVQVRRPYEPPRTPTEQILAQMWSDVLAVERVGVHDNFFELGGHSLLATQIVTRIRREAGVEVSLRTIFEAPTVEGLAAAIDRASQQGEAASHRATLVHDAAGRHQPFPLTDVQHAYWIGRGANVELGGVGTHVYNEFDVADLDLDRMRRAVARLVERHDMLRAVVRSDAQQQVLERAEVDIHVDDLRALEPAERDAALAATRARLSHEVLPSDRAPMLRVHVSRVTDRASRVHVGTDALILDAWSMLLLASEFLHLYRDPDAQLPPLEITFRDYVLAEVALESTEVYRRARAYWTARLERFPAAPDLPVVSATTGRAPHFTRCRATLPAAVWARARACAARASVTPSGLLLAAYAEVLARWSRSRRFAINLTLFSRLPLHPHVNAIAGDFTTLTLLEVEPGAGRTFEERARRVQEQLWRDLDHREFTGVRVMRELNRLKGRLGAAMPVVFTSTLGMVRQRGDAADDDGFARQVFGISQTPQVWLDLQVRDDDGSDLLCTLDHVEALFPPGMVPAMFDAMMELLRRLGEEPAAWQQPGAILPVARELAARTAANATSAAVPDGLLHAPFVAQARREPNRVAVITPHRTLTYGALLGLATALARRLRDAGAKPGTLVAVVAEKGWEQVAAVLAVHLAGAAYVPIDPALPHERIALLLADGDVRVVLTQAKLVDALRWPERVRAIAVDGAHDAAAAPEPPATVQRPTDLAYVIYTSGSTGRPKGVMIDHRGALNTIIDVNDRLALAPSDRVLGLSSLSFDLSVYDVFGTLAAGAALVLPDADRSRDPAHWLELAATHGVTVWNSVPALMSLAADAAVGRADAPLRSLRAVMLSGDWIPLALPDRVSALAPGAAVYSLGGATEASIWSIWYPIGGVDPGWKSVPYGKPMRNQTFHVLDEAMEPCPTWVPGQLYIGGIGLALGYWRDEEKTRTRFVRHPHTGERLYWTGDLGRYLPDGNIEFLGREDFQVKIQGHRIELGEIEAVLQQHDAVRDAVVRVREDAPNERRLVGYALLRDGATVTTDTLRMFLRQKLPEYMVPPAFVILESFPLSSNGKVDRNALPAPDDAAADAAVDGAAEDDEPRTEDEAVLAAIIASVLGVPRVGRRENFFALGGDSVRAIQVVLEARRRLPTWQLSARELFEHPTIEQLVSAQADRRADARPAPLDMSLAALPAGASAGLPIGAVDAFPLTAIQELMIDHYARNRDATGVYHNQLAFRVPYASPDLEAFRRAVAHVVAKHPALRTVFTRDAAGVRRQVVLERLDVPVEMRDLSAVPPVELDAALEALHREDRAALFDVDDPTAALVRFKLFKLPSGQTDLFVSHHHAILDGWSVFIVLPEILGTYLRLHSGEDVRSERDEASPSAAREYVALERETLASEATRAFWSAQLAGAPRIKLATAVRPPERVATPDARVSTLLPPEVTNEVRRVARQLRASPKAVFLAAYLEFLARELGRDELIVASVANGRSERLTNATGAIGLFWNFVPIRHRIVDGARAQITEVQRRLVEVEPHTRYPYLRALADAGLEDATAVAAGFNYVHFHHIAKQAAHTGVAGESVASSYAYDKYHFPLYVFVQPIVGGATRVNLYSDDERFELAALEPMARRFVDLVRSYAALQP